MTENNVSEPYGTLEYSSNNSGGSWWLKDDDWYALEAAGWTVRWKKDASDHPWFKPDKDGRWLGALATHAEIVVSSLADAKDKIREWEQITGQDITDEGCNCCGQPHNFHITKADGGWEDPVSVRRWSRWD